MAPDDTNVLHLANVTNWHTHAGISFRCPTGITLNTSGMFGGVTMRFPAGLGYAGSKDAIKLAASHTFSSHALLQGFYPESATASGAFFFCEESKPVWIEAHSFVWRGEEGRIEIAPGDVHYVRKHEMDVLEISAGLLVDPAMALKRSNEQYFRFVKAIDASVVEAGAQGDALLTTHITFDHGSFASHFPYDISNHWGGAGSELFLDRDQPLADLGYMDGVDPLPVRSGRDCSGEDCRGSVGAATFSFLPQSASLIFTPDGGLRRTGQLSAWAPLEWGAITNGGYAQQTTPFLYAEYHMPGHFLRGDAGGLPVDHPQRVAAILLSGAASGTGTAMERPGLYSYEDGFADYAGLNFRVGTHQGRSLLGGADSGWYNLSARSKYYVRDSGVSGIHEAEYGTFPTSLVIYGYTNSFSNYGLSYLSGLPQESRTEGSVFVPYPCEIEQDFEEMMFSCLGALTSAKIPEGAQDKTLDYWLADFQPFTIKFEDGTTDCTTPQRYLTMGIQTTIAHVEQPLFGVLGFHPDGNLIPADFGLNGVDSRLSLPNSLSFKGPQEESYYFTPICGAYYNHYADMADPAGNPGFVNLIGTLDVAFFSDMQVQLQTSASTNNPAALIYVMGGWPNHGWTNAAGEHFFTMDGFDGGNTGFPVDDATLEEYRTGEAYRPRALKTWAGVINLEYPLEWSHSARSFKSPEALEDDLLVLQVEHQVDYLSAENANVSFGIQYDGLPSISLGNMAFNALDEGTGMMSAFVNSVGSNVFSAMLEGMDELDAMLDDTLEDLFDPLLDELLDPVITNLYDALEAAHSAPGAATGWFTNEVARYVEGVSGPADNIRAKLEVIINGGADAADLLKRLDEALEKVEALIDGFVATSGYVEDPGLLKLTDGKYPVLDELASDIFRLLASWANETMKELIGTNIKEQLEKLKGSLDSIRETLLEVRDVVSEIRTRLDTGLDFAQELSNTIDPANLNTIASNAVARINDFFYERMPDPSVDFDEYTPEELKAMIKQAIRDEFLCSDLVPDVQQILRERVYDLNALLREACDSAFQQANLAIRQAAAPYLAEIDEQINGLLGDLSDIVGAGQINGYAHINGDSLKELRLDGKFNWEVPDAMEFNGYLIIKELNSENVAGCGASGGDATEVILGATDVGIAWISDGLTADISVKFAFENVSGVRVVGLGGAFELTGGSINFEAFTIEELAAAVAFGLYENYLSTATRARFSSYEVAGGVYFGRSCSLDPILLWDPDVAEVLGDPPFTGIYVYGQCYGPIYGGSCIFNISAGIGAGFFYFVEGPIGGKIYLAIGGEVLCLVSIKGEVTLIGCKNGNDLTMAGKGTLSGKVGSCPLCVEFSETVKVTYKNGSWSADY